MAKLNTLYMSSAKNIRKVFVSVFNDIETEHYGKSFKQVLADLQGQQVNLYLRKDTENIIGWADGEKVLIGNTGSSLDSKDYYTAYDKLF